MTSDRFGLFDRLPRPRPGLYVFVAALLAFFALPVGAQTTRPAFPKADPVTDEFFNKGVIPQIRITLSEEQMKSLKEKPREYVECVIKENPDKTYEKVKIKLKGSVGSFREITERPALTVKMTKKGERFHGLDKFHLNNSIQDPFYLNELICSQLAIEAGLPTARATHARVWINERDLGLYVLKEGHDEYWLGRFFASNKGNLYQAKQNQDVDFAMERDEGEGPVDRKDLEALAAACREKDKEKRYKLIEQHLDVDQFITFTAMELMMGHRDGYNANCNNYRIYFRPEDKRAVFILHGMDMMFRERRDRSTTLFDFPRRLVGRAVFENPVWWEKYQARVKELLPLFDAERLNPKLTAASERVTAVLATISKEEAAAYQARLPGYKQLVLGRQQVLKGQFPPDPITFDRDGVYLVGGWEPVNSSAAKLETTKGEKGQALYVISCLPAAATTAPPATGPAVAAGPARVESSFRSRVRMAKGKYVFEAKVKANGVVPIEDKKGQGAGVRLFSQASRENKVVGTSGDWEVVSVGFEVDRERDVALLLELRAVAGSAVFDGGSVVIRKVGK
jgi:hypothetical protein